MSKGSGTPTPSLEARLIARGAGTASTLLCGLLIMTIVYSTLRGADHKHSRCMALGCSFGAYVAWAVACTPLIAALGTPAAAPAQLVLVATGIATLLVAISHLAERTGKGTLHWSGLSTSAVAPLLAGGCTKLASLPCGTA
jgi:hypothetical protein